MRRTLAGIVLVAAGAAFPVFPSPLPAQPTSGPAPERNVAILVFPGVQIIDFTGPWEVFDTGPGFRVFTVAESDAEIVTEGGMRILPNYTLAIHPEPDILVIPGGAVFQSMGNPRLLDWIRRWTPEVEVVLTVCAGSFFLAKAGLLDGLEATTNAGLLQGLQAAAPEARVVADRRYVDTGRIVTSGGLMAGVDAALHVVEKLHGRARAQLVALGQEYRWEPERPWARASLADRHLPSRISAADAEVRLASTAGDVTWWEKVWSVRGAEGVRALHAAVERALAEPTQGSPFAWHKRDESLSPERAESAWAFADEAGSLWSGRLRVEADSGSTGEHRVTLRAEATADPAPASLRWEPPEEDPRLLPGGSMVGEPLPANLDTKLTRTSESGLFVVEAVPATLPIPPDRPHDWVLRVSEADGRPVTGALLEVGSGMPQHGHGGAELWPVEELGEGSYRLGQVRLASVRDEPAWIQVRVILRAGLREDLVVFDVVLPPRPSAPAAGPGVPEDRNEGAQ